MTNRPAGARLAPPRDTADPPRRTAEVRAARERIFARLLRTGDDRRVARLLGRLRPDDLTALLGGLSEFELRRAAHVLLSAEHVQHTAHGLPAASLSRLLAAATHADLARALEVVAPGPGIRALLNLMPRDRAHVLAMLPEARRRRMVRALPRHARPQTPADKGLGPVLRLRRLFA